ncbi:class I SAM-dependent methyltransferase [Paucibacter sp. DJ2R-2]|uniref:class I SAM-dependent methyltransferase n=1 Tax=Paucibacter sp. DJ2R-2 TaxID=2893558 RepID=UPI0021E474E6|nr:class I SAM-dependent methyltransferase [Paucibacter sp. DJ2R-2]MCV2422550.1 class I SAM-dependent methyltransferase [Paucibacter sp. DJ4R-1]MCV2438748.1 class I SAM-dependent methyltransferase [Paucibacter sp. DJ2R-2]
MTREASIIELASWLQTPPGQYLLQWEQRQLDAAVADIFGFHALQLGLPELPALRANRMPHRWLALDDQAASSHAQIASPVLLSEFDALPFESNSLDLVVLPHSLELAPDPHQTLREVERVLRPEGRLVILGLNPASLWGLRQNLGRLLPGEQKLFLPLAGEFLGYWRLRDWLRLLTFEVEAARFGCYSPPLRSEAWLERWGGIEPIGARWWPVLGAVYFIQAVKRVHGMRLIGLRRSRKFARAGAPAVLTQASQSPMPALRQPEPPALAAAAPPSSSSSL